MKKYNILTVQITKKLASVPDLSVLTEQRELSQRHVASLMGDVISLTCCGRLGTRLSQNYFGKKYYSCILILRLIDCGTINICIAVKSNFFDLHFYVLNFCQFIRVGTVFWFFPNNGMGVVKAVVQP